MYGFHLGGISSSVLSVFFTDKFALSQSDARISVAYKICQWKHWQNTWWIAPQGNRISKCQIPVLFSTAKRDRVKSTIGGKFFVTGLSAQDNTAVRQHEQSCFYDQIVWYQPLFGLQVTTGQVKWCGRNMAMTAYEAALPLCSRGLMGAVASWCARLQLG